MSLLGIVGVALTAALVVGLLIYRLDTWHGYHLAAEAGAYAFLIVLVLLVLLAIRDQWPLW